MWAQLHAFYSYHNNATHGVASRKAACLLACLVSRLRACLWLSPRSYIEKGCLLACLLSRLLACNAAHSYIEGGCLIAHSMTQPMELLRRRQHACLLAYDTALGVDCLLVRPLAWLLDYDLAHEVTLKEAYCFWAVCSLFISQWNPALTDVKGLPNFFYHWQILIIACMGNFKKWLKKTKNWYLL